MDAKRELSGLLAKICPDTGDMAEYVLGPSARGHTPSQLISQCQDAGLLPNLLAVALQLTGYHVQLKMLSIRLEADGLLRQRRLRQRDLVRTRSVVRFAPSVFRIEVRSGKDKHEALGTGFLIGPQLAITNFHVLRGLLPDGDSARLRHGLTLRFDATADEPKDSDGVVVNIEPGQRLLAFSPEGQLDYALLALPKASASGTDESQRPWIHAQDIDPARLAEAEPLYAFLIQHPEGQASRVDQGPVTSRFVLQDRRQLLYEIDTDYGSSGSPVILYDDSLLALHCARGAQNTNCNVGIFFPSIAKDIATRTGIDVFRRNWCHLKYDDDEMRITVPAGTDVIAYLKQSGMQDRIPHIMQGLTQPRRRTALAVYRDGENVFVSAYPGLMDSARRAVLQNDGEQYRLAEEPATFCPAGPNSKPLFDVWMEEEVTAGPLICLRRSDLETSPTLRILISCPATTVLENRVSEEA